MELTTEHLSVAAATLANGGVCPVTGEKVFGAEYVKRCLSMMGSCGMYDYSGEWAYTIGLPAKSGVCGAIMLVVPGLMGTCVYSPALDKLGNSVKGIAFCKRLTEHYSLHIYDSMIGTDKVDLRSSLVERRINQTGILLEAASMGDMNTLISLAASGVDLNLNDYDGRTALHLAASEGKENVVRYLIRQKVDLEPKDRWGGTPLTDAKREEHNGICVLLTQAMQKKLGKGAALAALWEERQEAAAGAGAADTPRHPQM